jgi:hypothetical protein
MILAKRIAQKITKIGEQFTVGSNTYLGIFKPLDSGTARTYLNDVDIMGIVNPGLVLITQPDAVIAIYDTITRDSKSYTVMRTYVHRVKGIPIFMLVVLG